MKLLLTKIKQYFIENGHYLSKDDLTDFRLIYSTFSGLMNLPSSLIELFSQVESKTDNDTYDEDNELVAKITKYLDNSLLDVDLGSDDSQLYLEPESSSANDLTVTKLKDFMTYVKSIIKDIKCFVWLLDFFRNESDITYFMPNSNVLLLFEVELCVDKEPTNEDMKEDTKNITTVNNDPPVPKKSTRKKKIKR